ncbi:hypothetical protein ACFLZN_01370, partial [Nanoarchaeota archaeon]
IAGYRLWLSSLDHQIQICSRTVNESITENILSFRTKIEDKIKTTKKNHKEKTTELKRLCNWITKYAEVNAPSMRLYYIVVPFFPYYPKKKDVKKMHRVEDYFKKVEKKCSTAVTLLKNAGINAVRMSDKELINLYSSFFTFSFYNKAGYYDTIESCISKWCQGEPI